MNNDYFYDNFCYDYYKNYYFEEDVTATCDFNLNAQEMSARNELSVRIVMSSDYHSVDWSSMWQESINWLEEGF